MDPDSWPKDEEACDQFGQTNRCPYWHLCKNHCKGNTVDQIGFQKSNPKSRGEVLKPKECEEPNKKEQTCPKRRRRGTKP